MQDKPYESEPSSFRCSRGKTSPLEPQEIDHDLTARRSRCASPCVPRFDFLLSLVRLVCVTLTIPDRCSTSHETHARSHLVRATKIFAVHFLRLTPANMLRIPPCFSTGRTRCKRPLPCERSGAIPSVHPRRRVPSTLSRDILFVNEE